MFSRAHIMGQVLLGLLVVGGGLSYALAQEDTEVEAEVDVVQVEPIGPIDREEEALSPSAQVERVGEVVEGASQSCAGQAEALKVARRDKDIIRATCIQDKVTQCNANLATLKRRQQAFNEALAANDAGQRNHEFTVIGVLEQKFKVLDQAAGECIGQDIFETGRTQVQPEVDPFNPDEDASVVVLPIPLDTIPYIPPPVSGVF